MEVGRGAGEQRRGKYQVLSPLPLCPSANHLCIVSLADYYLVTYTLIQGTRITLRSTIWRQTPQGWKIVYHQGTVVENA
ncbi:hypothetical protein [Nostoc foliaceum]|uniref:hypothetical protein n=1 Tax=Nostoc foliaceum TaxID=2692914 RepID=UPI0018EF5107|nr:hypothetical protein [Nostoc foliaceum]